MPTLVVPLSLRRPSRPRDTFCVACRPDVVLVYGYDFPWPCIHPPPIIPERAGIQETEWMSCVEFGDAALGMGDGLFSYAITPLA